MTSFTIDQLVADLLTARRQSDGRLLQRVLDPVTGKLSGKGNLFAEGWLGRGIQPAPASDGTAKPDGISLAIEGSPGGVAAQRRLAKGKLISTTVIVAAPQEPAPVSETP